MDRCNTVIYFTYLLEVNKRYSGYYAVKSSEDLALPNYFQIFIGSLAKAVLAILKVRPNVSQKCFKTIAETHFSHWGHMSTHREDLF